MVDPTSHNAVQVRLRSLKAAVDTIFEHLIDDLKIESVAIEPGENFYWDMDKKSLYDVKNDKPEIDIGSLSDDWNFLSKVTLDRQQAVSLMLIHAAPLLRYVGEKVGK